MKNLFRLSDAKGQIIIIGVLILLGFLLLDMLILGSLNILKISYGGIRLPLFAVMIIRGVIFFIWFLIVLISLSQRPGLGKIISSQPSTINRLPIWILIAVNLLVLAVEVDSFVIEPMELTVSRLTLKMPGLNQPIRIVQLSDIHVERASRRDLALPGFVNRLKPDVIVLTGDYLNESYKRDQISQNDLKKLMEQLHAPLGIYAVNGNVETRLNMDDIFKDLDIHLIDNEIVRLPQSGDDIVVIGLEYNRWYKDEKILADLMTRVKPQDISILLYHSPSLAYRARDLGIDLYLTGHTHGGQFRLPFYGAITTGSRYDKLFEMGRYQLDNMTMYVSRGLGMAGGITPRARFLCPPEVVVIDLVPITAQPGD